jgi:transcription termination/antitermination protein NusG
MAQAQWYTVQSYSGHENKVQRLIQQKIDQELGETPEDKEIQEALVPAQDVVEVKNGKRVTVTRRLYPGYVFVRMVLNERTLHVVNGIQGVIKFIGPGNHPQALRPEEVDQILGRKPAAGDDRPEIPFHPGQVVEVTQGPFTEFSGTVQEVLADKGKVKVEVSLFGRPTLVELDYTQLKGF